MNFQSLISLVWKPDQWKSLKIAEKHFKSLTNDTGQQKNKKLKIIQIPKFEFW